MSGVSPVGNTDNFCFSNDFKAFYLFDIFVFADDLKINSQSNGYYHQQTVIVSRSDFNIFSSFTKEEFNLMRKYTDYVNEVILVLIEYTQWV